VGFTREELQSFWGKGLPDLAGPEMRLLLVGINPGLWSAAAAAPFARRGNRFYPALHRAGIVDRLIDASAGLAADDADHLIERGVGITNVVDRATARADELTADELRDGVAVLEAKVAAWRPRVVAVLGITAYRTAFTAPAAQLGRQERTLAGAELWALPNPSGLNAHHQIDSLAEWYRHAAAAAEVT
jgi:TDG/mug DNA glycosylase family protein